jgi:hypothetical protein
LFMTGSLSIVEQKMSKINLFSLLLVCS